MIIVKIQSNSYMLPSGWNDLTEAQLYAIAPIVFCMEASPENKWRVLKLLLPAVRKRLWKKLNEDQVYDLIMAVEWIWKDEFSFMPMSEFKFEGKIYLLPEANFSNVSLIEYSMADHYLRAFLKNPGKSEALDNLIATICRPVKEKLVIDSSYDGDRRERYNSALAMERGKLFSNLDLPLKVMLLQFFVMGQKKVLKTYSAAFSKPQENSGGAGKSFDIGYMSLIYDLAEGNVFGDFEKTCFTPLTTVFLYLVKKKFDSLQDAS